MFPAISLSWYKGFIWYDMSKKESDMIYMYDMLCYVMIWYERIWSDMIWCDIWYDMIYDMKEYDVIYMIWYEFVCVLVFTATRLLSRPSSRQVTKGNLIGYTTGGLPIYNFQTPQSALTMFHSLMKQILEESESRQIFYFLCLNLVRYSANHKNV